MTWASSVSFWGHHMPSSPLSSRTKLLRIPTLIANSPVFPEFLRLFQAWMALSNKFAVGAFAKFCHKDVLYYPHSVFSLILAGRSNCEFYKGVRKEIDWCIRCRSRGHCPVKTISVGPIYVFNFRSMENIGGAREYDHISKLPRYRPAL